MGSGRDMSINKLDFGQTKTATVAVIHPFPLNPNWRNMATAHAAPYISEEDFSCFLRNFFGETPNL